MAVRPLSAEDPGRSTDVDDEPPAPAAPPNRWWVLTVVGVAQLMVVLDATIVNIALPSAQRALAFNNADRQWIVTGYSLGFGSLLLLGGRLADLAGRRRMLLIGLAASPPRRSSGAWRRASGCC